mmetsp:Transcript_101776/g.180466  ORF Transcript_101776/g.180466 Transcript_101776/m.180466 type:complete len:228 (-) Transcript_101776:53-736(-)
MAGSSALRAWDGTGRPPPEAGDEYLRAGMEVVVSGLQTRYDLNGSVGHLIDFNETTGRWRVDLGEGPGLRRFHPGNLEPTEAAAREALHRAREEGREERAAAALEAERIVCGEVGEEAAEPSLSAPALGDDSKESVGPSEGQEASGAGEQITITVFISRLADLKMEISVSETATIFDVRRAVAAQDSLQTTVVDDLKLGYLPESEDASPEPLPDDTLVAKGMELECC